MKPRPFHHQRPLAAVAVAYGLGVWAGVRFAWRPLLIAGGLAVSLIIIVLLPRVDRKRIVGCMAAALMAGMLLGGVAGHPALPAEGRYRVSGVLSADVRLREDGSAAGYLEDVTLTDAEGRESRLHRVYWTYTPEENAPFLPLEGDRVTFTGKVYHPDGQQNPYGFDFRLYLLTQGTAAGVSGCGEAEITAHPGRGVKTWTYQARKTLGSRIRQVFGEDSALPLALLIGQRDELPQETARSFSDAGTAHLLAVSGLHVGLLAGVLMLLLKRFLGPKSRLAVLAAFLLAYCALLDFAAPVVRASILLLLVQGRRLVRRMGDGLTTLAAAFLLILTVHPLALFTASFQLSFCAVLGIVLWEPDLMYWLSRLRPHFLHEGLAVTLSATAGVALPTIQIFHRFAWVGLLINPVLCALFAVLLPLYAAVLALGCICLPLGTALAAGVSAAGRGMIRAVEWVGGLPFVTLRLPSLPWYGLAALAFAGVLCTRYVVWPRRRKWLAAAAALAVAFGVWRGTVCHDVQYIQLSVGQADAALVLDGRETLVIDAGEDGYDLAGYLLSTGRRADTVILTHLHKDHCLGLRRLLEDRVPIGRVILPEGAEQLDVDPECLLLLEELRAQGIPIAHVHAGNVIETSRVRAEVTWPMEGLVRPGKEANRYSLCMLVDLDGVTVLTAGDIIGDYEGYAARDADLLKVAHHGSKNGTGQAFLDRVTPRAALISDSGHSGSLPHPEVLERLRDAGTAVFTTGSCGAVTVTVRGGAAELTTFLEEKEQP